MDKKYTPGPWQWVYGQYDASIHNNDGEIAHVDMDLIDWKANAQLIAAAPDMLRELENSWQVLWEIKEVARLYKLPTSVILAIELQIEQNNQAIKKALGKE